MFQLMLQELTDVSTLREWEHREPAMSEDELQDLSPEDANELRAFLEKRRWFEGKLQLLESLPPLLPFLHPNLIPPSTGCSPPTLVRRAESDSQWKLPDAGQVQIWQRERDALEEEVLAFDDGDLGRMKEKTRSATQLPLTPPSTHLVEITLALILLVDQLLALLRRRADVLELISVRLRWDELRWKVMLETAQIRQEISELARDKARWRPVALRSAADLEPTTPEQRDMSKSSSAISLSSAQALSSNPAAHVTGSSRALHLPVVHSPLTSLRARHRTLQNTTLAASGTMLDQMIEIAGPLIGLGSTRGPEDTERAENSGAVPEELLDQQDDLEVYLGDSGVKGELDFVAHLEYQWKKSDAYYSSSLKAREAAVRITAEVINALARPATSEEHARLSVLYDTASQLLPRSSPGHCIPRPAHAAFAGQSAHNDQIISALTLSFEEATADLRRATEGLAWYGGLAKRRESLLEQRQAAAVATKELERRLAALLGSEGERKRPDLSDLDSLASTSDAWSLSIPHVVEVIRTDRERWQNVAKLAQIKASRYRQELRNSPEAWQQGIVVFADGLPDDVEQESEELNELVDRCIDEAKAAEQIAGVHHHVQRTVARMDAIEKDLTSVRERIAEPMRSAIARRSAIDDVCGIRRELDHLGERMQNDVDAAMADLVDLLRPDERDHSALRMELANRAGNMRSRYVHLQQDLRRLERVVAQVQVLHTIQAEADDLVGKIKSTMVQVGEKSDEQLETDDGSNGLQSRTALLTDEVREWKETLAGRLPFVAGGPGQDVASQRLNRVQLRSPTVAASDPPMTPPPSPPTTTDEQSLGVSPTDLESLDRDARREVNEHALRVTSTLAGLQTVLAAEQQVRSLLCRLEALGIERLVEPLSATTPHTPTLRRLPTRDILQRIETELASISSAADEVPLASALGSPSTQSRLTRAISAACLLVPRLEQFVAFGEIVKECDRAISSALELFDAHEVGSELGTAEVKERVSAVIDRLKNEARPIESDKRVTAELNRILGMWSELQAMVDDAADPDQAQDDSIDGASEVSSLPSFRSGLPVRTPTSASGYRASRSTSNPALSAHRASPRPFSQRVVSDGQPLRARADGLRASNIPRLRKDSTRLASGQSAMSSSSPFGVPRDRKMSTGSNYVATTPARVRQTSRLPSSNVRPRKREYVADPKSKLDLAVAKVVNKLDVDVPIVPVGSTSTENPSDDWKDQSGRYWIGAEGRAKLCFCRILRSKMVMVRVGGGWVELSKFLMDHFADAFADWRPFDPSTPSHLGSATPIPITSASLGKHQQQHPGASQHHNPLTVTPVRQILPLPPPRSVSASPEKTSDLLFSSPAHEQSATTTSPGSPLVPLQFIRRASESPSLREKEKERLRVGRRSILGREGSAGL